MTASSVETATIWLDGEAGADALYGGLGTDTATYEDSNARAGGQLATGMFKRWTCRGEEDRVGNRDHVLHMFHDELEADVVSNDIEVAGCSHRPTGGAGATTSLYGDRPQHRLCHYKDSVILDCSQGASVPPSRIDATNTATAADAVHFTPAAPNFSASRLWQTEVDRRFARRTLYGDLAAHLRIAVSAQKCLPRPTSSFDPLAEPFRYGSRASAAVCHGRQRHETRSVGVYALVFTIALST